MKKGLYNRKKYGIITKRGVDLCAAKNQYGPVAQLGAHYIRIHSETRPTQVCGPVFHSDLLDFFPKIEYFRNPNSATFFV